MDSVVDVSVVLFREVPAIFPEFIRAIAAQTLAVRRVYVWGNGFDAQPAGALRDARASGGFDVKSEWRPDNIGFGAGHNENLRRAFICGAESVLLLNADVTLEADALAWLRAAELAVPTSLIGPLLLQAAAGPTTGAAVDTAGIVWTAAGRHLDWLQGGACVRVPPTRYAVRGISGAALYVPKSAYQVIVDASGEFFDEAFLAYREDAELGLRAHVAGVATYIEPRARGRHVRSLKGTSRKGGNLLNLLGVKNRFLIAFKYPTSVRGFAPRVWGRDAVVVLGALLWEQSSVAGVVEAWRVRRFCRMKARYLAFAGQRNEARPDSHA